MDALRRLAVDLDERLPDCSDGRSVNSNSPLRRRARFARTVFPTQRSCRFLGDQLVDQSSMDIRQSEISTCVAVG